MVIHPRRKVMTTLTLAGSLLWGTQSADAAVRSEGETEKQKVRDQRGNTEETVSQEQVAPQKMEYHVISSGIRLHMGAAGDSSSQAAQVGTSNRFHVVEKGETLGQIALKYGLELDGLIQLNPQIADPDVIQVGEQIRLSGKVKGSGSVEVAGESGSAETKGAVTLSSADESGAADGHVDAQASAVIREAQAQLDGAYSHGANGPNRFDCSGFTQFVFQQVGIDLPRTSSAQASVGVSVDGELRVGDLLFFRTGGGGISHVSIYMGDGKMIHATNPEEDVTINRLDEDYWSERYVSARRVLP